MLGHNLIGFDLPILQALNPNLQLLQLPAVDTLRLNPLAFPRNPYHHLVKYYQDGALRRGRINDPELDARLALDLFKDQLSALGDAPSDLLTAWHWLTTTDGARGFDLVFSTLRQSGRPSDDQAHDALAARLEGNACRTYASEVIEDAAQYGWELSYSTGLAIRCRRQFGHTSLGTAPIPECWAIGPQAAGYRLYRSRMRVVPGEA